MRLKIHTSTELLEPLSYLLSFFLGFEAGGFQFILLEIAQEFQLNNTAMGSFVSVESAAIMMGPLLFGGLGDRIGKKPVVIFFAFVFVIGCFIITNTLSLIVLFIGIFLVGFGYSLCQSATIAALADAYGKESAEPIHMSQCLFSIGAVLGPLVTHYTMEEWGFDWRIVFSIAGGGYFILLFPLFMTKFVNRSSRQYHPALGSGRKEPPWQSILCSPAFLCLFLSILIYVGMENGLAFFLDLMFTDELNASAQSSFSVSLFWLAMIPARFLAGIFCRHQQLFLLVGFGGAAIFLYLLTTATQPIQALACCFLLGLFYGPIWPSITCLATNEFPNHSGRVAGIMLAGSGFGGAASPVLMGRLADIADIRTSYGVLSVMASFGMIIMLLYTGRRILRHRS